MISSRALLACVIFVNLLASVAIAGEADREDLAGANVVVTIRMGTIEDANKTTLSTSRVVAVHGGGEVELMSGLRVPIAVTSFQASTPPSGEIVPMTSYTYQNVGFTAQIRVWVRDDGRIDLRAEIEQSNVVGGGDPASPWIETDHQKVRAVLTENTPLEIMRIEDVDGRTTFYEIEADVL
ncbi:MAG: hypothetical protein R3344_08090 [Acidobacteriota bacterium]|nr:hypothetical protein [Acidobacteriota bacterium]